MSSQKRLLLFFVLSFVMVYGTQALMERMGLIPPPKPPAAPAANAEATKPAVAQADAGPGAAPKPAAPATPPQTAGVKRPEPEAVKANELVLGADDDDDPRAYHLRVQLDQVGAAVREIDAARYSGETADGIPDRKTRLALVQPDPLSHAPLSLATTFRDASKVAADGPLPQGETDHDSRRWEVVREGAGGPIVRPITRKSADGAVVEGQEIAFRSTVDDPPATVTKRYRLWKGEDGFEFSITTDAAKDAKVGYRLFGPHGIPIEGESYTANFRDVFFGQVKGGTVQIATKSAADVVKAKANPEVFESLPLKFAGVENQYFAVFVEPVPTPIVAKAMAFVARENAAAPQKSDVGVEIISGPLDVAPDHGVTHDYKVFAGPKTRAALAPYGAEDLASYRKYQLISIPFASSLAQNVIAPLLDKIYGVTTWVANLFGFKNGSYGVAIILLTITVRLMMFPIGRKQALISKKMQELQPHLAAIKEKYKDDKERQTKETLELYRAHGFNPAAGCLPALIQLPIFVGLWQALNNSVPLRHSTFLYIKNLAAPDMLFSFPTELPIVGKYFNLLPFFVVALMLVQTKLFSPPAVSEEQRMQQKMMKYMMVFMAFMFYRVPSGLGLYFITSSLWSIGERLLLPKLTRSKKVESGGEGNGEVATLVPTPKPAGGVNGWLSKKLQSLLEQAENERTIRNSNSSPGNGREPEPERNRNRPRPGKRR
ncbi:MAG TPA: membrane protein insertase YidC [Isosphaeraceae bacterium]